MKNIFSFRWLGGGWIWTPPFANVHTPLSALSFLSDFWGGVAGFLSTEGFWVSVVAITSPHQKKKKKTPFDTVSDDFSWCWYNPIHYFLVRKAASFKKFVIDYGQWVNGLELLFEFSERTALFYVFNQRESLPINLWGILDRYPRLGTRNPLADVRSSTKTCPLTNSYYMKKNLWRRKCVRRELFRNVEVLTLFSTRPTLSLCDLSGVILHQKWI